MNLSAALKAGIFPNNANPIDIILTAHSERLEDLLQKQIPRHHKIMKISKDVTEARDKFQVKCDFDDVEITRMTDLQSWEEDLGTCSCYGSSSDSSILNSLRRKKIHRPVADSTVTHCYNCNSAFGSFFGMVNRRHHCRACGRIFCYNCSQWNEVIPNDIISYTDTKKWLTPGQPQRVCQSCKDMILNFRRIEKLVEYFEIVAYPFDLCVRASTLSRDWREAMRIYLSNVRDIQYSLPSCKLTERDLRALDSNMSYFNGHNKWILQVLKKGIIPPDHNIRVRPCKLMMCDGNCSHQLTPFDALIILNTPTYSPEVKLLALKILDNEKFPADVALFLPIEETSVQEFILRRPDLFFDFFWLSRIDHGLSTDVFKNKLMLSNHDQAHSVQESIHLISMLENYQNLYSLSQNLQSLKVPFMGPFGMIDKFESEVVEKASATRPIMMKYHDNGVKRAFLYKCEDVRKDSHVVALIRLMYHLCSDIFDNCKHTAFLPTSSRAIDIVDQRRDSGSWFTRDSPIITNSFKHPSSLPNIIRSSPINISKYIPPSPLSEDSILDMMANEFAHSPSDIPNDASEESYADKSVESDFKFLATYRVMPVSNNSGFIEIVQNAHTLSDILARGTISNYLYRSNVDKSVREVSSNYSASLAFWTVVTYLLGVGDRHLKNIMIRNDGILFHIDYGFVFGADTTASFVRLDKDLIEGLGGNEMYEPFKIRCCEIYCSLRRHFNLVCACLLRLATIRPPIKGYDFTPQFIERFVTDRFLLGQTEDEARDAFSNIIDSSRETLVTKVSDMIHSTMNTLKVNWWSQ